MAEKIARNHQNSPGIPGGMGTGEKSKNLKKAYADFIHYLGRYKWSILAAAIFSVAGAILNLIGPNKLSEVTDLITEGLSGSIQLSAVVQIASLLAVLYAFGFLLNYAQGFIMATVSQRITQNMRRDISTKINKLPLRYFDSHSTGDVLSRVTNDVDTVGQTMNQSFSTLVSSLSLLIGSVLMMFLTNWIMAVTGIIAALIGFSGILFIISKSQKYFAEQQQELGSLNGQVEETYSGFTVVKAYNGGRKAKEEFHQRSSRLYACAWKSQFLSGLMMPFMIFIGNFAYVVVCIVGAVLAVQGSISFGTIVAFMLYIRLFTQPLQNISQALSSVQSMAASCERVFEFLAEKEMEDESYKKVELCSVKGDVIFDHVKFGYDPGKTIINDFSSRVKAGQKIAIVGPTGAGKTTMVNLLMRFYELNGGTITIDGTPINELKRENIHNLFGMVLQDTWMFEGTLRENLVYSKTGVTDKKLDEVCAATGLTSLVKRLPDGYDTVLGDNASLSAGQKQLITIARAMIEDAPLLILDEATSSVDTRTEQKVQKAMDSLTEGRTSFVIAHRLSTIKNADCILVMKDGDIIESGSHEELLAQNGFYAELYNSQFEQAS
ncbi:ABC transporter, ATP-binding protein [Marvinbryantia formatexigens DSM 14469]|uniref:ABC transporter, ATP-binding protein n=1 Tax=Marvinbryantia formatexigens DSM 14469 TaxID=478749 RepID=C6LHU6_9FIRM|nr:ABC transporter ATP-binding protein [Marvinbryantia formatexigens]EET59836.1 ABC transporter, ATP-binding protein [Marvinbryantia formatexigens DSM 14469]